MGKFLPSRLKKAREDAGLTQEAFAQSLGLSSEFISLLESGKRAPSLETLSRISAHFHKDSSFFLGERESAFTVLFRAPAAGLSPDARLEFERFRRYVDDYLRLEESTGRRLELAPLYSGRLDPGRMAAEERRRLGLGDEPIRDIFALLERNGLRILRSPLPPSVEISGIFIFLEAQNAAFALINSAQTICRQIFSAAHEYCHYLKDRQDPPLIDTPRIFDMLAMSNAGRGHPANRFAQEFAAHFLLPPAKVREIVEARSGPARLSYEDILFIKRYFGVSVKAMLITLRNMDILGPALIDEFSAIDAAAREKEVFGTTDEDYGPGLGLDSSGFIVSDRYRLMEKEVSALDISFKIGNPQKGGNH